MSFISQNSKNEYLEAFNFFGVSPDTPFDVIKSIYKKLVLKYHPDKNKSPFAESYLKKLNNAFSYIEDFYKNVNNEELKENFNFSEKNKKYWNTPWGEFFDNQEKYEISLNNFFINLYKSATFKLKKIIKKILCANLKDYYKYSFKKIIEIILNSSLSVKEWAVNSLFENINKKLLLPYVPLFNSN